MREAVCASCGKKLGTDDVGLSRKLINRGLEEKDCMCVSCLSVRFSASEDVLRKKISEWREAGCLLFREKDPG